MLLFSAKAVNCMTKISDKKIEEKDGFKKIV